MRLRQKLVKSQLAALRLNHLQSLQSLVPNRWIEIVHNIDLFSF